MPNNLNELKELIRSQIRREEAAIAAQRAVDIRPQVVAPTNPMGATPERGFDGAFATGYDAGAGVTTIPFTVGVSIVGGDDIVIFST